MRWLHTSTFPSLYPREGTHPWGGFTICEVSEEGLPFVRSVRKVYPICEVSEEGLSYVRSVRKVYHMWGQWGRFTICEVSEEGLSYVRSVRKVYHMWGQWGRFTICEVSEKGLPYVRSVRKVYLLQKVDLTWLYYLTRRQPDKLLIRVSSAQQEATKIKHG